MNLSQLQSEIGRLLNDPSNQRWSTDILTTRINLAQIEIQGLTDAVKTSESLTGLGSSNPLNPATMNIITVGKIYTDNTVKTLPGITFQELFFRYPDNAQWDPGDPIFWIYYASSQTLVLIPTPDSTIARLSVYASRKPADLVNPTDLPFDSNNQMIPYHMSIVHWVVAQCWMDDGTPEALGKSRFHKSGDPMKPGQYELQLARIKAEFDIPEAVQAHILYQPQGGRLGGVFNFPTKSFPLGL